MAREHKGASAASVREHFYITRDSQNAGIKDSDSQKLSYVGMRNLTDVDQIEEQDIVSARGTIRGKRNRVRAGLANFENPKALEKLNTERGKVVVYVTSFRGVRATFEECRYILDLFHNLRIRVVAKDIYMYQFYHKELEERLMHGQSSVPQVFIGGQHIGGKAELEELNEAGELRKVLAEYPHYETANKCTVCAGFEFIPCRKCGGSKNSTANKFTSEFRALRCTQCNVNGMEACPACEQKRKEMEEELKKQLETMSTTNTVKQKLEKEEEREPLVDGSHEVQQSREEDKERQTEELCRETEEDREMKNETAEEVRADTKNNSSVRDKAVEDKCGEREQPGDREEKASDVDSVESDSEQINTTEILKKYIRDLEDVQF